MYTVLLTFRVNGTSVAGIQFLECSWGERAAFQVWRMYMREPVEGCDAEWAKPGGMSVAEVL